MRPLLLSAVLLLAGCDAHDFERSGALLQTSADRYDAEVLLTGGPDRVEVTIPYTMRSPDGARTVYAGCVNPGPAGLQKRVGGEWVPVYTPVVPQCLSTPFVLKAGETRPDTLRLYAPFPGQNYAPEFEADEVPGTYRLVQEIYAGSDGDGQGRDLLPLEARASNPFELR